ncbi:hypothetical protein [Paenibacillus sp. YIM B09110]|uniref:hypothetical protein n=1 Tax=Paenibacillus sp. YIM B09110 TaxID=3126102 RepID=UPI00301D8775
MDIQLFEEALEGIENSKTIETVSLNTHRFFVDHNMPNYVIEFYGKFSFTEPLRFGRNLFYKTNDLLEENQDIPNSKCIDSGLLIVGHGLNGDYIVLNMKTNSIGYIFHDELYENEDIRIEDIYIDMCMNLGEFFNRSVFEEGFPVDGYQAEEYRNSR